MSIPTTGNPPNAGLVALAWLSGIPGLNPGMVASALPRDVVKWREEGFVQATIIPSAAAVDSGAARVAWIQLDAWAVNADAAGNVSDRRPVARAWRLAELVLRGLEDAEQASRFGRPVALPEAYDGARVLAGWPITEPTDVPDDPSGYARVTFDFALSWARI